MVKNGWLMIAIKTKKAMDVKEAYQGIYVEFSEVEDEDILLSHFGRFTIELTHSLSERLETLMMKKKFSASTIKKMFTIIIEGLKSLCLNGGKCQNEHQRGHIMIKSDPKGRYNISIGNSVSQDKIEEICNNIDHVNQLSPEEIKESYNRSLLNTIESNTESDNLGLTIMSMKAQSKIKYQIINCMSGCCYLEMRLMLTD